VLARAFGFLGPVEAVASLAMLPVGGDAVLRLAPGNAMPADGTALATLSTMVFAAIVLGQMGNAFECPSTRLSLRALRPASNRLLVGRSLSRAWPCSGSSIRSRCRRCSACGR
jgi:hypothetical protein